MFNTASIKFIVVFIDKSIKTHSSVLPHIPVDVVHQARITARGMGIEFGEDRKK